MNKKGIAIAIILAVILVVCVVLAYSQNDTTKQETPDAVIQEQLQVPEPVVKEGHYTIFMYCQNGWTNHLYATAYYENDHKVYAELREYPGEFVPVDGQTLPIPEWIEDVDELMEYGFWEPMESDW